MVKVIARWGVFNVLALILLLAVLAPEWWAFFKSDLLVFVNGWDEETYLSWQGVLGAIQIPGYSSSYLNLLLHNLGISGATQNLIFDTVLLPLTILFSGLIFRNLNFAKERIFVYALILCLSSVLFNYANPVVSYILGTYDGAAILMAGHEYYPSILRTPNPQFSYFALSVTIYFFTKYRRGWILILPLPLMYFYVAIPYLFLIFFLYSSRYMQKLLNISGITNTAITFILIYFLVSSAVALLFYIGGLYNPENHLRQYSQFFIEARRPQIPLMLGLLMCVFGALFFIGKLNIDKKKLVFLGWIFLAGVATVNMHVVAGLMLSQKNYYDYGLSVLLSLFLVLTIDLIVSVRVRNAIIVIIIVLVSWLSLKSQMTYSMHSIAMSKKVSLVVGDMKDDPLHILVPQIEVSSLVAYSAPKMLSPPFSYLYYFNFIERQCKYYQYLLDDAMFYSEKELKNNPVELIDLKKTYDKIKNSSENAKLVPYKDLNYCTTQTYLNKNFKLKLVP